MSHTDSDGSWPIDRFKKYGHTKGSITGENIAITESPIETVVAWIVDYGEPLRSHRLNIFDDYIQTANNTTSCLLNKKCLYTT